MCKLVLGAWMTILHIVNTLTLTVKLGLEDADPEEKACCHYTYYYYRHEVVVGWYGGYVVVVGISPPACDTTGRQSAHP